ncbi:hypothetical protein V7S43_009917 [Phytophthora oleae]|uniref:Crinkler effector protein N-terminal domain-containing protein n=1 Tax=Phytophthora oleae TaxID=2107226 RepID=A0ABD3FIB0_9STRA
MAKLNLFCAIFGEAEDAFGVEIDDIEQVCKLQAAIKAKVPHAITSPASRLKPFLAKTESGAWLPDDDNREKMLQNLVHTSKMKKLRPSWKLNKPELFGPNVSLGEEVIHVLVVIKGEFPKAETVEASHPRKRRWDKLNEVLDMNKKAKKADDSNGFSYVSFPDIDSIMPATRYQPTSKPIADEKLAALDVYLPTLAKVFGDMYVGNEAKRLYFIMPVLATVCALFNDVEVLVEETIVGKRVQVDGTFEFVLKRGEKRVSIVQAKREDFQQGLAQAYVGSEALADSEGCRKCTALSRTSSDGSSREVWMAKLSIQHP